MSYETPRQKAARLAGFAGHVFDYKGNLPQFKGKRVEIMIPSAKLLYEGDEPYMGEAWQRPAGEYKDIFWGDLDLSKPQAAIDAVLLIEGQSILRVL